MSGGWGKLGLRTKSIRDFGRLSCMKGYKCAGMLVCQHVDMQVCRVVGMLVCRYVVGRYVGTYFETYFMVGRCRYDCSHLCVRL